jgi:CBS domain containing-hemolysin-like protein
MILAIVSASPFTRLPAYRGSLDQVIGILQTKDVVIEYIEGNGLHDVRRLLRPVVTVPQTMPADRLLGFLRERRTHQALVVDPQGRLVGLVTLEDVVAELLGEVGDELKALPGGQPRG